MSWFLLFLAGLLEISWAVGLKYTDGFRNLMPTAATAGALIVSVALLGLSMRTLPLGTAYAIWTGIGTLGTVIIGMMVFGESTSAARLGCIALIIAGICGLKLTT